MKKSPVVSDPCVSPKTYVVRSLLDHQADELLLLSLEQVNETRGEGGSVTAKLFLLESGEEMFLWSPGDKEMEFPLQDRARCLCSMLV